MGIELSINNYEELEMLRKGLVATGCLGTALYTNIYELQAIAGHTEYCENASVVGSKKGWQLPGYPMEEYLAVEVTHIPIAQPYPTEIKWIRVK